VSISRPLLRGAGVLVGALVATHAWRLRRATTMELDHAAYWRRRRRSPGAVLLVALGDSLAQGMGAIHPEQSWAGRLADELAARRATTVRVVNLAVCGASVADALEHQLHDVPPAAFSDPTAVVALAVGTNDAAADTDPEVFRARLGALCDALPAGTLVADVPDLQRGVVRDRGARLAAVAREVVAARPGLRPVALEEATHRMRIWESGPDLAHPSGLGYRRYGRAFAAALDVSAVGHR
jgi:lysophospholipase L1-like esterase